MFKTEMLNLCWLQMVRNCVMLLLLLNYNATKVGIREMVNAFVVNEDT